MREKKDKNIKTTILDKIKRSPEHSVFFLNDIASITSLETVRKVLSQACDTGLLTHVAHGIYVKPMISRFGEVPIPLEKIAEEIAARDHVHIMPTGSTAANILGISTQVTMTVSYLTTGASREIKIGNRVIRFRRAAPRNLEKRIYERTNSLPSRDTCQWQTIRKLLQKTYCWHLCGSGV